MSSTEIVTFEKATALTGKKAIDFFTKPENVEPIIQQVQNEALSLVPNVKTKAGRDEIGSTALKVSKSRKAIVEAIERSVADLKSQVQAATEVKKLVESELNETRRQVLQPRNEWQAEQDRIEAERVAEIKTRIENIQAIGNYTESETKDDLATRIDALEAMDVSEGFAEFASDAATAIAEATKRLNARILAIVEQEKAEEQRKQLEAEQKKNRINERLTNLVQIPLGLMGKSSSEIQKKIDSLKAFAVLEEDFEDRTDEAKTSLDQVISQLGMMLTQAKQLEEAQPKQQPEVGIDMAEGEDTTATKEVKLSESAPFGITKNSYPELFESFKDGCDFDTSDIPKHGKGFVVPEVEYEGRLYRYNMKLVWDYSWGIEEWLDSEGAWLVVDANPVSKGGVLSKEADSLNEEIILWFAEINDTYPSDGDSEKLQLIISKYL